VRACSPCFREADLTILSSVHPQIVRACSPCFREVDLTVFLRSHILRMWVPVLLASVKLT